MTKPYGYLCEVGNPPFKFFVENAKDEDGQPLMAETDLGNGLKVFPIWREFNVTPAEPLYVAHEQAAEAHAIASEYAGQGFPTGTPDHIISEFRELAEKHSKHAVNLSAKLGMLNLESDTHDGYDHYGLRRRHMTIAQTLKN